MASLLLPCSTITSQSCPPRPNFFSNPPHLSTHTTRTRRFEISCSAENGGQNPPNEEISMGKFDRRNVLLGMGGLYTATNLVSSANYSQPAIATPIPAPDIAECTTGTDLNTGQPLDIDCCPPNSEIKDYKLPPVTKLRVRPAAQLASKEYIAKYEKAIELMKALPDDDPRSFIQQANVHCAYCNLTYPQTPNSTVKLEIHNSWLFMPWHRWYVYFIERILGKLIDDPTFGLPFWNWDNPAGMVMPEFYAKKDSSFYDELRNPAHLPPAVVDLNYSGGSSSKPPPQQILENLVEMYGELIRNAKTLEDFYGAPYVVGTPPNPGPGTVERGSHDAVHLWVGQDTTEKFHMGNFSVAARDPIFYGHHSNIDRLWTVWRQLRGTRPSAFSTKEWLEAAFLFYDENKQLVRVRVKDTLENEKMGYTFQQIITPWSTNRPKPRFKKSKVATTSSAAKATEITFPVKLDKIVKVVVDRPKKSRSKEEKEREEELLVIEGIEVDTSKAVRFEVFVNDEEDKPEELLDKAEYAGCYSQVPNKKSVKIKTKIRLGLTELLEDLEIEDDDKILVSLVPKAGDITIGGIKIIFAS